MKKKILIVINSLGIGGAEKSLVAMLDTLDYSRFDVELQMLNYGGAFEALLPPEVTVLPSPEYLQFCHLPISAQLKSRNARFIKTRLQVTRSLRKNIRSGRPLHDTQAYWKAAARAFENNRTEYAAAIAWGQGTPTHYVAEKVCAQKKIAWVNANYEAMGHNKAFDRPVYENYDNIVCVSNQLSDIFREVFPEFAEKIRVILDIQNPEVIRKMAAEEVAVDLQKKHIITSVGRLMPSKNFSLAIQAAKLLRERGLDFIWYIVGGGDQWEKLATQIRRDGLQSQVVLTGAKNNPYPYIQAAEVYVQTSRSEGFCLTLAEARLLNVPCVSTSFDTVFDQMVNGENGLVVDLSPEAVADGVQRLLEDRELYDHIKAYLQQEKKGNREEIEKIYTLLEGKN